LPQRDTYSPASWEFYYSAAGVPSDKLPASAPGEYWSSGSISASERRIRSLRSSKATLAKGPGRPSKTIAASISDTAEINRRAARSIANSKAAGSGSFSRIAISYRSDEIMKKGSWTPAPLIGHSGFFTTSRSNTANNPSVTDALFSPPDTSTSGVNRMPFSASTVKICSIE